MLPVRAILFGSITPAVIRLPNGAARYSLAGYSLTGSRTRCGRDIDVGSAATSIARNVHGLNVMNSEMNLTMRQTNRIAVEYSERTAYTRKRTIKDEQVNAEGTG